jgi:hypothetical protein
MTPLGVVFVPIPVCGQTWNKRAPQPRYPSKRPETWPLRQSIPSDETRRMLDDARRNLAENRQRLVEMAREGQRP